MIATWMLYGCASGVLLALVGWLVQRGLQQLMLPIRWVWAGVIVGSVLLFAVAPFAARVARGPAARNDQGSLTLAARNIGAAPAVPDASPVASLAARVAALDRPLFLAWMLASVGLIFTILRATRMAARRPDDDVDGVPVVVTDAIGPAAMGMRCPRILLPRWALELEPALRSLVLRHEQEHIRARDPALLVMAIISVALLPWQPALWWSLRRLRLAIELDCDARVLRAHPDVRRYGELLLLVGERTAARTWRRVLPDVALATLLPSRSTLKWRIMAMTHPRSSRSPALATLLFAAAVAVVLVACELPTPPARPVRASSIKPGQGGVATVTTMSGVTGKITVRFTVSSADDKPVMVRLVRSDSADFVINAPQAMYFHDKLVMRTPITGTGHLDRGGLTFISDDNREFEVQAYIDGGPAMHLSGRGRHMTLNRGGAGISTLW